ncbi:MAG: CorA family divalent cation transporter, partial [Caulobacteraceae bacterium]
LNNAALRQTLAALGASGDRLSMTRDALLGVARIAPFVMERGHACICEADHQTRLKAVRMDVASLADYETHLSDKTQFLLDAVLGLINVAQNDIFKVLTIVSVVGIPPTFIASMYGMNFHRMPELEWAWGYPYALGLIVVSTLLPLAWFKWRKWM